ncbi:hypothetical protein AC1031_002523 [Aphanomyces cochlioides]|nr:hypothetical protein AC1031_002523 [Aphanomyces cochlioides]
MGLCQGKELGFMASKPGIKLDTSAKSVAAPPPPRPPHASSPTTIVQSPPTPQPKELVPPARRTTVAKANEHLLLLLPPSDPILDDMDFLDAPDHIATSIEVSNLPENARPIRHVAALAVQNKSFKPHMEDECIVTPVHFHDEAHPRLQLYAVYDGHGGGFVSKYLAKRLHHAVIQHFSQHEDVEAALTESFKTVDIELEALEDADRCGSTAVVFAAAGSRVWIANVGDSHCLHISDTTCSRVTQDHHVRNCDEVNRIKAKRGIIVNQRVSGVSKVTRAFGQNDEKDFIISSPAITTLEVNDDAVFVLMSDGVSDVLSDDEIASIVRRGLSAGWTLALICRSLIDICKLKRAGDNMSVILVQI